MKVEDSTLAVVRALERMGVRHYVTGSLWSDALGVARAQQGRLDLEYLRRWSRARSTSSSVC